LSEPFARAWIGRELSIRKETIMPVMTGYEHGQFAWVDLTAHNMAAARDFYCSLFGWTSVDTDTHGGPSYAQFELDGHSVAGLGQMRSETRDSGVPPMWNSYVYVDDAHAVAQKAVELGGKITMPVMKVLEAGWLAFVRDPTGGRVGIWQKNEHFGAARVNDVGCFCWNELATRDVDKACRFYGDLFGWEFTEFAPSEAKYFIARNRGRENAGIMQIRDEWGEMPPCWNVYFTVEDVDQTVARLGQLGGKVEVPPFDLAVGRMSVVTDPQGAYFNLVRMNAPP
jgi:predicted enzyme related to lactoylglutathione lyase